MDGWLAGWLGIARASLDWVGLYIDGVEIEKDRIGKDKSIEPDTLADMYECICACACVGITK